MRSRVAIGLVALGLAAAATAQETRYRIDDLAWMAGSWATVENGKRSEEHWTGPAGGVMLGVHRDVRGATAAFEFLRIEETAGAVTYLASPQGRPPTPFALIEIAEQRAVFANPQHDFPQRILYWREGDALCAAVEGPLDDEPVRQEWCWRPGSLRGGS
ncbi:MAG TPA: DUF6265 family protein [Thermoanaerobaculia bacterium]|nr:DUF6265 family protein [Thermoanaerobaculia bacterium]